MKERHDVEATITGLQFKLLSNVIRRGADVAVCERYNFWASRRA